MRAEKTCCLSLVRKMDVSWSCLYTRLWAGTCTMTISCRYQLHITRKSVILALAMEAITGPMIGDGGRRVAAEVPAQGLRRYGDSSV